MANLPEQVTSASTAHDAHAGHGAKSGTFLERIRRKPKPSPPEPGAKMRRSELFVGEGASVNERGRLQDAESAEWVALSQETKAHYRVFLEGHMQAMKRLREQDRSIFSDTRFKYEKQLLDHFEAAGGGVDITKIDEFLKRPEGWKVATMIIDQQIAYKQFALGVLVNTNIPDVSDDVSRTLRKINLNQTGSETLSRRQRVGDWLAGSPFKDLGSIIEDNSHYTQQMFEMIKNDPALAAYVRTTTGLDARDYEFDPVDGQYKKVRTGASESIKSPHDLARELQGNMIVKNNFLRELGVPKSERRMTSFRWMADGYDGEPATTGLIHEDLVMRLFEPNAGGIRDTAGGIVIRGMTPVLAPDHQANMRRYMEAQAKAIAQTMGKYKENEAAESVTGGTKARPNDVLSEKLTARTDPTKERARRTADTAREVETLGQRKIEAEARLRRFDSLQQQRDPQRGIVAELSGPPFSLKGLTADMSSVALSTIVNAEIAKIDRDIKAGGLDTARDTAWNAYHSAVEGKYDTLVSTARGSLRRGTDLTDADLQHYRRLAQTDPAFTAQRLAWETAEAALKPYKERKDLLEAKREEYRVNAVAIANAEKELVPDPQLLTDMRDDVRSLVRVTGATIDEASLREMPLQWLIDKAKNPPYNMPYDTPAAREMLHQKILRARAESIARLGEKKREPKYDRIVGVSKPIKPDDLFHKSRTELVSILRTDPNYAALMAKGIPPEDLIEEAKTLAMQRLLKREEIFLREQVSDVDARIIDRNKFIETYDLSKETNQIKTAQEAIAQEGEAFKHARMIDDEDRVEKYMDRNIVDAADETYTKAERDSGALKGYVEMLDVLFAYRGKADREATFTRLSAVLTPDKMAGLLNEGMELGLAAGTLLTDVFQEVENRVKAGTTDRTEIRAGLVRIIDQLTAEAMSLP